MKTQLPLHNRLFEYIRDLDIIAELDAQIKHKEQDISNMSQLITIYEDLHCENMADDMAKRCNAAEEELIFLLLDKNRIERKILAFRLNALYAD